MLYNYIYMSSKLPKFITIDPKRKYKVAPTKRTAIINEGLANLDTYSSDNIMHQTMIDLIRKQYADKEIQNIKTAVSAMDSLANDCLNEFNKKFNAILNKIPVKQAKFATSREKATARLDAEMSKVVETVDRVVNRPSVNIKHWETEAPFIGGYI